MVPRRFLQLALALMALVAVAQALGKGHGHGSSTKLCPIPNVKDIVCIQYLDQCHTDYDCGHGETCCLVPNCGRQCYPLYNKPVTKPGNCPAIPFIALNCSYKEKINECLFDKQCPGYLKCCFVGCSLKCTKPL
uniref:Whey acidic protein n=1 Tax=Eriocheir sinensis TaxID=95602 RepID=A0A0N6XEM9_ERISI|nr:whey acidic protein [Eriocheir sinensis]